MSCAFKIFISNTALLQPSSVLVYKTLSKIFSKQLKQFPMPSVTILQSEGENPHRIPLRSLNVCLPWFHVTIKNKIRTIHDVTEAVN